MHWSRAILHVDMDAFYASVEQRDHPALRGVPVVVGGAPEHRGVVSAASYEARSFGVRSAMPMAKALRLCPHARRIAPRMRVYASESAKLHDLFHEYTPLVQGVGLDEAYLDVTGSQALFGSAPEIGARIKRAVRRRLGLNASVGVAPNRFVAKIASDLEKPDGFTVVRENDVLKRLAPLPVGRIWGVGPVTERKLRRLGVATVAQLRAWPSAALATHFGAFGRELHDLARGIDHSPVEADAREKSMSQEVTFAEDVLDRAALERELLRQAESVAHRLREQGLAARTVQLKLRYDDFTTVTRRESLPEPFDLSETIHQTAVALLRGRTEAGDRRVRLIGVGAANLSPAGVAPASLFEAEDAEHLRRRGRAERAVDAIRARLGDASIQRASLLDAPPEGEEDTPSPVS